MPTPAPVPPLSRAELEHTGVAADVAQVRKQLVGVWDGHAFEIDGELGSGPPTTGAPLTLTFNADGSLIRTDDSGVRQGADCTPRTRTYTVERNDTETDIAVRSTGGCPSDASYGTSYTMRYVVSRLDDRILVLIDGSTAAVTGFRRQ